MEAHETSLAEFIGNKNTLIIPVYQRNYNWLKDNCERLFQDIENIITYDKPHFIGTFVYQAKRDGYFSYYTLIDGQQRITSVILLARALYDFIDDVDEKSTIRQIFLRHSGGKYQFKLKPTEFDRDVFIKLMDENFNENNFTETEKFSSMYINYKFFRQRITASKYSAKEIYNAISHLKIVRILLHTENPQEIFESLNSTGLDLSNSDLIRNFLLMSLDSNAQESLYKNYWLQIERLLKSPDAVENFMVQYLITKRRSNSIQHGNSKVKLSKTILYNSFKKYFQKFYNGDDRNDEVEKFLKDAYRYAKFYSQCVFNESTNFDEKTFIKFVDALISLSFRAKVCKLGVIAAQFAGNVIARLDKENFLTEELFWQTLTFGKGTYTFPSDEDFKNALTNSEAYVNIKADGCKYFLYSLEKNFPAENELPDYDEVTVDHVVPQRLNQNWKIYLNARNDSQAHENWRNTLGNLILVSDKKSVGADFQTKKFFAHDSTFQFTRDLEKYSEWTSKQIQARAKKLANAAVKIWTLPEEYQRNNVNVESIFNLDSDFELFTGKKLAIISVFNVEKSVSTWRDFQEEFVKQLYALDSETFKMAAKKFDDSRKRKLFSTDSADLNAALKIDDNFFVESTLSTVQKLKFMNSILEIFDEISGTNFKEDIWFTIKN